MPTTEMPAHHKPNIPAAVQRAAALADEVFHRQNQDQAGGDPASAEAPAGQDASTSSEPPAPAPATTTVVAAPPAPPAEQIDWQHKFNSLKGKHDAEMARMQAEIEGLHRVLGSMQAAAAQPPAGPGAPPAPASAPPGFDLDFRPISDDERADYGEEFLSVAERAAAQKFAPVIKNLMAEIQTLKQNVNTVATTVQNDARTNVFEMLNAEVPDWEAQDRDPLFIDWLRYPDPFSGQQRQVLLDKAMQDADGRRVVAFFKAFKDLQAAQRAPQSPPPSPAAPQPQPRTSLETLAAPGRGRTGTSSGTPGPTDNGAVYTQSQIAKFYEDVRRGVWRNDPAGKARREADIVKAATEGRIRAG